MREQYEAALKDVLDKNYVGFEEKIGSVLKQKLEKKLNDKIEEITMNLFARNNEETTEEF